MPLGHTSKLYAVSDCKLYKMLTDVAGGSATYAAAVDVPGIKTVAIGGDITTAQLRGDNSLLDQAATVGGLTVSVEHAKMSLDAIAVLLGGSVADSGTTPNMKSTWDLTGTSTPAYFKLEAKTPSNGSDFIGGSVNITLHKLMLSSFPSLGFAEEDYQTVSFDAVGMPLLATGVKALTLAFNETDAALSA